MRNIVCFHNPNEINGYLSNWYLSDFIIDGIKFTSIEQYMMYKKAILFNDTEIASQIMKTSNVGKIKSLGRSVRNYCESQWNGMRQIIVYNGLLEKFKQSEELSARLLSTDNDILAECAVHDNIWGIGKSMTDLCRYNIEEWAGENLLGYSLMMVREELRKRR